MLLPLRIEVKNFGPFAERIFDFGSSRTVAVVGRNGAGKSTLVSDAPLWALFGATRGDADSVVRRPGGEDAPFGPCTVRFWFSHGGTKYRVERTRSFTGAARRGHTALTFLRYDGASATDLSGATPRDTERVISDLLSLDEGTFEASSMVRQGMADSFSRAAPGERKAVLSRILRLDRCEELRAAARKKMALEGAEREASTSRLAAMRANLAKRGPATIEIELRTAEDVRAEKEELVRTSAEALERTKKERAAAEVLASRVPTLETACEAAKTNKKSAAAVMEGVERSLAEVRELVLRLPEVEAAERIVAETSESMKERELLVMGLTRLREEYKAARERYNARAAEYNKLAERRKKLASAADTAATSGFGEDLTKRLASAREAVDKARSRSAALAAERNDVSTKMAELSAARTKLLGERRVNEERAEAARKSVEILESSCCVAPDAAREAPCRFLREAVETGRRLREEYGPREIELASALEGLEKELRETEGKLAVLDGERSDGEAAERRCAELEAEYAKRELFMARRAELSELAARLSDLKVEANKEHTAMFETERRGKESKAKLDALDASGAKERYEAAQKIAGERGAVDAAVSAVPRLAEELERAREGLERSKAASAAAEKELSESRAAANQFAEADGRCRELERAYACVREELEAANKSVWSLTEELKSATIQTEEADKLELELAGGALRMDVWSKLDAAFGKDGIPAMAVNTVLGDVERTANDLLGMMSDFRHTVSLRTAREKKDGGSADTLDIVVSDWDGERPYETFSGGEKLRIDLALRVALAELLALRSGAPIEWLTVDEGLGSQDDEHRGKMLSALRDIAPRFGKVVVVTHVKEAREFFDEVVEIEPDRRAERCSKDEGSKEPNE